jgi:hypothetical protein
MTLRVILRLTDLFATGAGWPLPIYKKLAPHLSPYINPINNKKFLEVSEPFFKKVLTRRRLFFNELSSGFQDSLCIGKGLFFQVAGEGDGLFGTHPGILDRDTCFQDHCGQFA